MHIYYQDNTARRFQLELDIANYTQDDLTIEQYYSGFLNLWGEYFGIFNAKVSAVVLSTLREVQEISKHDQFFMKL